MYSISLGTNWVVVLLFQWQETSLSPGEVLIEQRIEAEEFVCVCSCEGNGENWKASNSIPKRFQMIGNWYSGDKWPTKISSVGYFVSII